MSASDGNPLFMPVSVWEDGLRWITDELRPAVDEDARPKLDEWLRAQWVIVEVCANMQEE